MCKVSVSCLRDCATYGGRLKYISGTAAKPLVRARKPTGRDAGMFAYWHPRENLVSEMVCVRFRRHVVPACASFLDSFMSQCASAGRVARTCRLHTSRSSRSQGRARPSHMAGAVVMRTLTPQTVQPSSRVDALSGAPPRERLVSPLASRCIGGSARMCFLATTALGALG
jgi:hypothetical protein